MNSEMEEENAFVIVGFGLPTRSCLVCFHMMTFSWQKGVGKNTSRWSYVTKSATPKLVKKSLLEGSIQFLITNYKELYGAHRDTYSASPVCLLMISIRWLRPRVSHTDWCMRGTGFGQGSKLLWVNLWEDSRLDISVDNVFFRYLTGLVSGRWVEGVCLCPAQVFAWAPAQHLLLSIRVGELVDQ